MIFFKNVISLLLGSVLSFMIFHIIFNLLFGGGLIFDKTKLNYSKVFFILLAISFAGALVISFMNIEKTMVNAFVGGISSFLAVVAKKKLR